MAGWSEGGLDRAVALPGTRNGPPTLMPETIKRHLQLSKGFGNVLASCKAKFTRSTMIVGPFNFISDLLTSAGP